MGDPDGSSIDSDSIQYDGVVRHFSVKLTNNDGGYSIAHETINCEDRSFRVDDSSTYDRAGNVLSHSAYHETMTEIEEGTTAEEYLYRVCR